MTRELRNLGAAVIAGLSAPFCLAAHAPVAAQEVVQALPDPAAADLSDALRRLARSPTSLPALLAAGEASLALDDIDAAHGFYTRAQDVAPEDGRVAAGLAMVALREGDAARALDLFAQAEAAGADLGLLAAERGLARDLVGDNVGAQALYRQALDRAPSPEVTRRLALSQAMAGNAAASEATLLPLLQRQDQAAFRTRAFALAILGQADEAITIAETMLPARLSGRLAPFLRYMPRLTRAQQAAAANLGQFPPAAEIGKADPRLARYLNDTDRPARAAGPDARLIPGGPALGEPASPAAAAGPGSESTRQAATPTGAARPTRRDGNSPASLDEIFADLPQPRRVRPGPMAPGAVDIATIDPPRERPAPSRPEPPPQPVHPARQWVQVATGRDLAAFRFDWRRLRRESDGLLDGREAFHTAWGQTNRLLTGPFANADEAQAFVTSLAQSGVDAFRFGSAQGQEITPLQ